MIEAQNHPLYSTDRENLDRLSGIDTPAPTDFVELARLLIRYQDFKGADDLNSDMDKLLKKWKINREKLETITRKIWSDGFRPTSSSGSDNVGSGFDTSDSSQN
ncbi:DUF3288 family protein [Prochlorococcus marinus]|uniref:DUF3288 domain-containing protein n=1 Tax=Prochlorococcus marinus XMU1408 TaxID=2213228 RepID=A0A318R0F5_PROMR|nr:DUF3288 family protein [Prochlorococcus marinus]MBW3041886.1 DUF3288 domain-containing protein [Prochlorococcus marinus str. XMU1408]PYE03017.1 DUF3288 domain-containing protein [Prochlorococcus marinus XMU1408]